MNHVLSSSRRPRPRRGSRVLLTAVAVSALTGCGLGGGEQSAASAEADATTPAPAAPSTLSVGETLPTDPPRSTPAQVVLTFADWDPGAGAVVAGGYASPVVEDDGTCTLELTKGGESVTATAGAEADATTTSCDTLSVPGDQLSPGTWRAVLRYESSAMSGTSDARKVEVPA